MTKEDLQAMLPVRIMRVEDWLKVAELFQIPIQGVSPSALKCASVIDLIERYEKEVHQPLERKHFVAERQDPISVLPISAAARRFTREPGQSDLIFEGFEELSSHAVCISGRIIIIFKKEFTRITINRDSYSTDVSYCTIFDLIYHISKYNETADTKIELNFTEQFCKKIT